MNQPMAPDEDQETSVLDKRKPATIPVLLRGAGFQLIISFAICGGSLFGAAGDVTWLRGWAHTGLWLVTFTINASVLLRLNREMVSARLNPKWSNERADTILLMLFLLVTLAMPVVAGLDAVRYS